MGWPITGLVPKGPDDDTGMILVSLHHASAAFQNTVQPLGVGGRHDCIVVERRVESMRLKVGFIYQIEPILVAQFIPVVIDESYFLHTSLRKPSLIKYSKAHQYQ